MILKHRKNQILFFVISFFCFIFVILFGLRNNVKDLNKELSQIKKKISNALADSIDTKLKRERNVKIIAISKRQPLEKLIAALDNGHKIFGENQVQETLNKWPTLKEKYLNIELHLVGPLQSNKAKDAVSIFDVIQTVDREKIAKALKKEEDNLQKKISYMIQINTGEESQKSGIMPNDADDFFKYCKEDLKLNIEGLMCIPPYNEDSSIHFAYLRKKNLEYKLLTFFVLPPSKKALFNRLSNRDMKDKLIVFWQSHSETIITLGYKVVLALAILVASALIARSVKKAIKNSKSPLKKVDETLLPLLSSIAGYLVYIIAGLFILDIFGVNTASLIALMGAAGLAIGLALKNTLSNIAAGIMLLILRPFKIGDFVDASGTLGTVNEINLFTTIFKTTDGLYIASPNGKVWGGNIKNFTRNGKRRMDIVVGISYADSIDVGLNVLKEVAESESRLLAEPAPKVMVTSIGESAVNIQLRAWAVNGDYWQTVWDLNKRVKEAIEGAGLSIPFPQRTLHISESMASAVTVNTNPQ